MTDDCVCCAMTLPPCQYRWNLPDDIEIGECRVSRCRRINDPFEDCIVIERADRYILVTDEFIAHMDKRFARLGDGILTLHGRDGDVSYGLSHYNPYLRQSLGTRSG